MHNLVEKKWWNTGTVFPQPVSVICTQNSGLDPDNREKMEQPDLVNELIRMLIERTRH